MDLEMNWGEEADNNTCPSQELFYCTGNHSQSVVASEYLAIPAILSSCFSCFGSAVIIFTYCRWKEIRTGSRAIITYLSIADFLTAFGYIVGSLNYFINIHMKGDTCGPFNVVCEIQSFLTSTSSLSSFLWTCSLAIYLYLSLVHNKVVFAQKLFPAFHVINWGAPFVITVPILATGYLGFSHYAASTWCYIANKDKNAEEETVEKVLVMMAGKLWEILTYLVVIVLYILIKRHISVQSKKGLASKSLNANLVALLRRSDKKLVAIPVLFVLLRMWGTLQFFYSLGVEGYVHQSCTNHRSVHDGFVFFGVMQAIGDGGQGWANFILYVIVSDKVRRKLLHCCDDSDNRHNPSLNNLQRSSSIDPGINFSYGTLKKSQERQKTQPGQKLVDSVEVEPTTA